MLQLHRDVTLREAISQAHAEIGDLHDVPLERCRLVKYNEFYDSIDCSWDNRLDETIYDVFDGLRSSYKFDLLLEMIGQGQQFQQYTPGSLSIKVLLVDVDTKELCTPVTVRMPANSTVGDLKLNIQGAFLSIIHLFSVFNWSRVYCQFGPFYFPLSRQCYERLIQLILCLSLICFYWFCCLLYTFLLVGDFLF